MHLAATLDAGESMAQQFTWEDPPAGEYTARATLAAQDVDVDATTTLTV